ncbi:MAG: hypothetical protein NTX25_03530, partial [Proteobacteria bacterium]|nr:hypothetical protein [Pseudomonadota bacterium]
FRLPDSILGVTSEMQTFVKANQAMIEKDPFGYFIYVLYAEYFTVLAGPPCLAAIEKNCKIPMSLMSIIGKHAELDRDHVQDWALDAQNVGLRRDHLAKYQEILQDIMFRYEIFCEALSDKYEQVA